MMRYPRFLYLSFATTSVLVGSTVLFLGRTTTTTDPRAPDPPHRRAVAAGSEQTCGFQGNGDIYGLGIRVGIYLQWLASILQKQFLVRVNLGLQRDLLDANSIFCLAIFVATILLSTGPVGPVYRVEVLIMLHIFFGSTYIVSYDHLIRDKRKKSVTVYGIAVLLYITCGMSAYAIWFWFGGLDGLLAAECGDYAFLFAKVALAGRARIFFEVAAVFNMVLWGVGGLLLGIVLVRLFCQVMFFLPLFAVKAAWERFSAWIADGDVEKEAKWRDQGQGHGRWYLSLMFGGLGQEGSTREEQAWYQLAETRYGPRGGWEEFVSRSKKDNFIVYATSPLTRCCL